ncbi:MAG TPA: cytochrome c3 family protein, partial [Armatimonadota bacterium]
MASKQPKEHTDGAPVGWRKRLVRLALLALRWGAIAVVGIIILSGVGMEVSSTPKFCASCHNMKPYYQSWAQSSHKNVACIECHFPPGVKGELRKKFEALVQVAKYVTNQYGTRPWTQIEDASCLRSGCHEKRLLNGKVLFKGVQFDHTPHLTKFRRVTKLRCTSCHSQLVQGQHMTVTESTCFLCHFKQGKPEEAAIVKDLSTCTRCHKFPITSTKFDHQVVQKRGVACTECHSNVKHGDGDVPKERCLLCHSEENRLARYSDVTFMHKNHVTNYKIECSQCHNTIQHTIQKDAEAFVDTEKTNLCNKCHDMEHNATAQLYAGRGGAGVTGTPAVMFQAGINCQSCHRTHGAGKGPKAMPHAGVVGCNLCHGEQYNAQLAKWSLEFGEPVKQYYTSLQQTEGKIANLSFDPTRKQQALRLISKAEANVKLVRDANGVHNPEFARQLLQTAAGQANQALSLVGLGTRVSVPTRGGAQIKPAECAVCHTSAPSDRKTVFGIQFSHLPHVGKAALACTTCHVGGTPDKGDHGNFKLTKGDCQACHQRRAANPHAANWTQAHGKQARQDSTSCTVCHKASTCNACHGTAMPHGSGWTTDHGTQAEKSPE